MASVKFIHKIVLTDLSDELYWLKKKSNPSSTRNKDKKDHFLSKMKITILENKFNHTYIQRGMPRTDKKRKGVDRGNTDLASDAIGPGVDATDPL